MDIKEAEELFRKYKEKRASAEERALLMDWCQNLGTDEPSGLSEAELNAIVEEMSHILPLPLPAPQKKHKLWPGLAAAVILLIAISSSLFFFSYPSGSGPHSITAQNDIGPGSNKAILTLNNGTEISLSDAKNGKLADQAGISVVKAKDGSLIYTMKDSVSGHGMNRNTFLNTLSTPKGGQYQIILPDGTKVWLNSVSSLRFPASFAGLKERVVELKGEAYFEVSKNKNVPFKVKSTSQTVEVLGTHFNIKTYEDEEDTKTTLLEGSVRISPRDERQTFSPGLLEPGQQAQLANTPGAKIKITTANIEQAMAWKNGYFHFENDNLQSVMKQLSRWYDLDIVYKVDRPDDEFIGDISRAVKLSEAVKILEMGGVHFKIEGKTLTVIK